VNAAAARLLTYFENIFVVIFEKKQFRRQNNAAFLLSILLLECPLYCAACTARAV